MSVQARCDAHIHFIEPRWTETLARSASGSGVQPVISGEVDCHYRPPAASLSWPDVCYRQMMRKRLRGWRALRKHRKTPEERGDCLRPLVLTGLSFNSICSITAVCVETHSIGRQIQETLTGKQAFSLWFSQWTCSNSSNSVWLHSLSRVWNDYKVALRVNGATLYSEGQKGIKKQAGEKVLTSDPWIYGPTSPKAGLSIQ